MLTSVLLGSRTSLVTAIALAACVGQVGENGDLSDDIADVDGNDTDSDPSDPDTTPDPDPTDDPGNDDDPVIDDPPDPEPPPVIVGEPDDLVGITEAHNAVRAIDGVGPMTWDDDLEAVAQAWAEQCINVEPPSTLIDHNPGRSANYPGYVGENIAGGVSPMSAQSAVNLWAAEKQHYDYDSNTCAQGQVCGHYTQVVWATSTKLGCARTTCAGITYGNGIVCNYAPGGNYNGQRPY